MGAVPSRHAALGEACPEAPRGSGMTKCRPACRRAAGGAGRGVCTRIIIKPYGVSLSRDWPERRQAGRGAAGRG